MWAEYGNMAIRMASIKMTFSLDEATAARLDRTAKELRRPKSHIVREAIEEYTDRVGRLSESERRRLLDVLDTHMAAMPVTPAEDVEAELEEIRRSRHEGGRRSGR